MDYIEYYINQYKKKRSPDLPGFAFEAKDRAMNELAGESFPSKKNEKYLYTPIASVFEQELVVHQPSAKDFSEKEISMILNSNLPEIDAYSILLNNGYHVSNESIHELPGGIILGSVNSMFKTYDHIYREYLAAYTPSGDVLVNLNTMLSGDGFLLFVPEKATPAKPIQIINLLDGPQNTLIQPRNLIVMERRSSADVFICDLTLSGDSFVCNDVTEVLLNRNAKLNLTRLQDINGKSRLVSSTIIHQAASTRMKTHYISLNGGVIRNNLSVTLSGKDAEHFAGGLTFTRHAEHTDHDVKITHAIPGCHSNQLFRSVLSDTSTAAYTGRIVVAKDAQKTLAYQRSNNILLHPDAKMNIRPQLEIYADDVKCSHGATVGQLDNEALFYLRSRGLGENEAKKLLLGAFAGEVTDGIESAPVRELIKELVDHKLEEVF